MRVGVDLSKKRIQNVSYYHNGYESVHENTIFGILVRFAIIYNLVANTALLLYDETNITSPARSVHLDFRCACSHAPGAPKMLYIFLVSGTFCMRFSLCELWSVSGVWKYQRYYHGYEDALRGYASTLKYIILCSALFLRYRTHMAHFSSSGV